VFNLAERAVAVDNPLNQELLKLALIEAFNQGVCNLLLSWFENIQAEHRDDIARRCLFGHSVLRL
jgi:hypothetical protein